MRNNRRQFLRTVTAGGAVAIASASRGNAEQRAGVLQPARSSLSRSQTRAEFPGTANPKDGFTVELTVDLKQFDGQRRNILEMPDVLTVSLRHHDPFDRERQNYPAFKMPDGSVPVLEANVALYSIEHPDWKNMTIGIPLAMLTRSEGEHRVVLNFSGVRWTIYVDGEMLDNDFPFGYPKWSDRNTWKVDPDYVKAAVLYFPAMELEKEPAEKLIASPIQYWVPSGHNNWVGDVVTFFHQGRYHLFYLFDRRHHQSKFGKGAHYFEHLSTKDFKTWTEHEAATPIEEQWECIGTGTPFVFRNRFCLSYGLHTGRVYPEEKTTWPAQWEYLKKNGRTGTFPRGTTPGIPAGATYSVSADGVSAFKKSNLTFHPCQNPSVYTDPEGRLRMLANSGSSGTWESESVDGGWHSINPGFPPGGDCTFYFRWGKFDYIIGGFTGLWSKPAGAPDSAYEDVVRKGFDFYDGLNVPSITEIADGRFLMAGWIPIRGWGGTLVVRELLQFSDGRIGSKWMKEITPETGKSETIGPRVAGTMTLSPNYRSFMLTVDVYPTEAKKSRFGISFLPATGAQASCELQVGLNDMRAQFGPGSLDRFAGPEKSLCEGGAPAKARDYAIENLIGVDRAFTVRVIVQNSDKLGGSLVDAEIAGQRTMISYRPDLIVKRMVFRTESVELKNVRIAAVGNSVSRP